MQEQQNTATGATQSIGSVSVVSINGQPVFHVSGEDLAQLNDVIDRWERFLDIVFSHPSTRKMDNDLLERVSMEDAERYLDVKIQLSQCLGADVDQALLERFDERFNAIRRLTYRYITKDLPALCENSRNLMALARGRVQPSTGDEPAEPDAVGGVDPGLRYKDNLVLRRQKLKARISRQQAEVAEKIVELKQVISERLRPMESGTS